MSRVSWLNVIESTARAKSRLRPVLISRKEKKIESLKTCNFTIIDNGSLKRTASKAGELIGRRPCPKEKEARRTWSWNTTKRECRRSRWVPTHVLMFRVVACWTFLVFLKFSSKLNFKTIFTTAEASPLTFRCSKPSTDNSARSFVLESLHRNRRVFILCKSIYDGFRKQKKRNDLSAHRMSLLELPLHAILAHIEPIQQLVNTGKEKRSDAHSNGRIVDSEGSERLSKAKQRKWRN